MMLVCLLKIRLPHLVASTGLGYPARVVTTEAVTQPEPGLVMYSDPPDTRAGPHAADITSSATAGKFSGGCEKKKKTNVVVDTEPPSPGECLVQLVPLLPLPATSRHVLGSGVGCRAVTVPLQGSAECNV